MITMLVPVQESGSIDYPNLDSGTDYLVFMKSIAEDGRESEYTSSEPFTTSTYNNPKCIIYQEYNSRNLIREPLQLAANG